MSSTLPFSNSYSYRYLHTDAYSNSNSNSNSDANANRRCTAGPDSESGDVYRQKQLHRELEESKRGNRLPGGCVHELFV
jgi:hypothetical protein